MTRRLAIAGAIALAVLIPGALLATGFGPRGIATRLRRITPVSSVRHKPEAPIRIELAPGRVLPDGTQGVRLVVTPLVDAEEVEIEVTADEGLGVLQGAPRRRSHARRKHPIHSDFILGSVPAAPGRRSQRLVVTAAMTFPMAPGETQEERRREVAVAAWAASPRAVTLEEAHPGARRVRTRDGRRVLEIPGE